MILRRTARILLYLFLLSSVAVAALAAVIYLRIEPQLPSIEVLREVQLQEPLRIYARDRSILAEFGDKRRTPVNIDEVPPMLVYAFLAAEDDHFFTHSGVDIPGLMSAAVELVITGEKRRGASTITMQVARNFFLPTEKTYWRKLTEILLAFKIEDSLSKNEILELYLNKIYLGHHAYGVEAAAQVYYGKSISELSVAQMATIAALPKAPSRVNPINSPAETLERRNYILGRMKKLGYIDQQTHELAVAEQDDAALHMVQVEASAPYVAEMVRLEMVRRYGNAVYNSGYEVITTLDVKRQQAANEALRKDLIAYSQRHGYRGAEAHFSLDELPSEEWPGLLSEFSVIGGLDAGLVTRVDEKSIDVLLQEQESITISWEGLSWARPYLSAYSMGKPPKQASDILKVGDVIRVYQDDGLWKLTQIPKIEGALVSLLPDDGAIVALVGGFDYRQSKFNRATQAKRQPGSSFKPIVYSAALEKGFTPASMINDAPVVFDDPNLESTWRPENYSGQFYGPTRLREALYRSRNLVSIRILRAIGASYVVEYAQRFGFTPEQLPNDLTLALGSASVTPLQMARAYAVLANGGYLIDPYFIQNIYDASGEEIFAANPAIACSECPEPNEDASGSATEVIKRAPQVLTPQNVWLMTSMMQDVIQRGTGRKARVLGRTDLAGKTGTTNDQKDGWFSGFNQSLVATAWVGFDKLEPLGRGETGGRSALPMWIDYMAVALEGVKEQKRQLPPGLVTVRIDPATGLLAGSGQSDAVFETFREEDVPKQSSDALGRGSAQGTSDGATEQLF
ncbi:MAG: penicillin-binding protein 1A [Gammaproteobacteria bacterium]|nr:penicillin-binding protein 1A [Gammaproteobacteria bacterium]